MAKNKKRINKLYDDEFGDRFDRVQQNDKREKKIKNALRSCNIDDLIEDDDDDYFDGEM